MIFSLHADTKLLLDWWPNSNHIPLYVGIEKGYFTEEGIDLTIIKSDSAPQAYINLMSKNADIALYYLPQALRHSHKYPNLKILGVLIKEPLQSFVFRKADGIRTPKDLDGKSIGLNHDGLTSKYLTYFETSYKISLKRKKIDFDLLISLYTNWVDVLSGVFWNIEPIQLKHLGIETDYLKITDFGVPTYPELIFLTRGEILDRDPTFAGRFQRALQKSISESTLHPNQAFEIYRVKHPNKSKKTIQMERCSWEITLPLLATTQTFNTNELHQITSWLISKELIDTKTNCLMLLSNNNY